MEMASSVQRSSQMQRSRKSLGPIWSWMMAQVQDAGFRRYESRDAGFDGCYELQGAELHGCEFLQGGSDNSHVRLFQAGFGDFQDQKGADLLRDAGFEACELRHAGVDDVHELQGDGNLADQSQGAGFSSHAWFLGPAPHYLARQQHVGTTGGRLNKYGWNLRRRTMMWRLHPLCPEVDQDCDSLPPLPFSICSNPLDRAKRFMPDELPALMRPRSSHSQRTGRRMPLLANTEPCTKTSRWRLATLRRWSLMRSWRRKLACLYNMNSF